MGISVVYKRHFEFDRRRQRADTLANGLNKNGPAKSSVCKNDGRMRIRNDNYDRRMRMTNDK